jgi:hypothetical protein
MREAHIICKRCKANHNPKNCKWDYNIDWSNQVDLPKPDNPGILPQMDFDIGTHVPKPNISGRGHENKRNKSYVDYNKLRNKSVQHHQMELSDNDENPHQLSSVNAVIERLGLETDEDFAARVKSIQELCSKVNYVYEVGEENKDKEDGNSNDNSDCFSLSYNNLFSS